MSDYRRVFVNGGTYFFTVVTYRRFPVFYDKSAINLLNECLESTSASHSFKIDAMVILPDHLHIIWTLPADDSDYSIRWKKIKAKFSRNYSGSRAKVFSDSMAVKNEKGIWQRRFWEHTIRDQQDFNNHCDYIHYNPVKHGLVSSPVEWKYSSFKDFVKEGFYEPDWGSEIGKSILDMDFE
ncbi:MAG: transposase [Dehalococcoidales bacterium]|nr:transposase [Dehalococcoidales bacterium]